MEIKGIIKQVAREGKAVMLDNDQWYSHFSSTTQFQVGDAVKITYNDKVKGDVTYHNWTLIEPQEAGIGDNDGPVPIVKPGENVVVPRGIDLKNLKNGSMYASYAKDIFCALCKSEQRGDDLQITEPNKVMKLSIELVKQAKEAFE